MTRLLACLALIGLAGPAAACLNDVELSSHEREFRSQYNGPGNPSPAPGPNSAGEPSTGLLIGGGAALLSVAIALTLTGTRSRS